jgi:hypothetical protein
LVVEEQKVKAYDFAIVSIPGMKSRSLMLKFDVLKSMHQNKISRIIMAAISYLSRHIFGGLVENVAVSFVKLDILRQKSDRKTREFL